MPRDPREYGLTPEDRLHEIDRKFGRERRDSVLARLDQVIAPSEKILGAILFISRQGQIADIEAMVALANEDPQRLLDSAQVVDERR